MGIYHFITVSICSSINFLLMQYLIVFFEQSARPLSIDFHQSVFTSQSMLPDFIKWISKPHKFFFVLLLWNFLYILYKGFPKLLNLIWNLLNSSLHLLLLQEVSFQKHQFSIKILILYQQKSLKFCKLIVNFICLTLKIKIIRLFNFLIFSKLFKICLALL